jgi:hypothetical protein
MPDLEFHWYDTGHVLNDVAALADRARFLAAWLELPALNGNQAKAEELIQAPPLDSATSPGSGGSRSTFASCGRPALLVWGVLPTWEGSKSPQLAAGRRLGAPRRWGGVEAARHQWCSIPGRASATPSVWLAGSDHH